ncbi:hypothetical protein [Metapseudomonas resinovorans]|nr:hypothetical protein [Pseudomonas resinovorans]
MSNAERQRAYRERQKAQRHGKAKPRAAKAERERDEKAGIRLRELESQLTGLQALYQLRSDQLAEWMADNRKLKEQLAQRQGHSSEVAIWWAEIKLKGSRTWERLDSPIMMAPITEQDMKTWMRDWKASAGMKRRAARDDGMIYEPQDAR